MTPCDGLQNWCKIQNRLDNPEKWSKHLDCDIKFTLEIVNICTGMLYSEN